MAGLTAELEVPESVVVSVSVDSALLESVVDSVPVESVSVASVLVESVSASVDVPVSPVLSESSVLSVVVVLVDESEPDRSVVWVSAHSCRPSADAAITAARPIVPVMMVLSLLPRSCRFMPCRLPGRVSDVRYAGPFSMNPDCGPALCACYERSVSYPVVFAVNHENRMPALRTGVKKVLTRRRCQGIIDTMTSSDSTIPRRPRWYAAAIVVAILLIAALTLTSAFIADDAADTVLGFFAGMIAALMLALVLWTEIVRTWLARRRDAAALDDLEPLGAATGSDRAATGAATAQSAERTADTPTDR